MPRGIKTQVVATRLSETEMAHLDVQRGQMTRSQYLRYLLLKARKDK